MYTVSLTCKTSLAKFEASMAYGWGSTPGFTDSGVSTNNNLSVITSFEFFNFNFIVSPSTTLSTLASSEPSGISDLDLFKASLCCVTLELSIVSRLEHPPKNNDKDNTDDNNNVLIFFVLNNFISLSP